MRVIVISMFILFGGFLYSMDETGCPLIKNRGYSNLQRLFMPDDYMPRKVSKESEILRLLKKVSASSQRLQQQLREKRPQTERECLK